VFRARRSHARRCAAAGASRGPNARAAVTRGSDGTRRSRRAPFSKRRRR
jgi:hypothetical protein